MVDTTLPVGFVVRDTQALSVNVQRCVVWRLQGEDSHRCRKGSKACSRSPFAVSLTVQDCFGSIDRWSLNPLELTAEATKAYTFYGFFQEVRTAEALFITG